MSLPHRSAGRSRQVFCTSARLCLVHGFFPSVGATGPAGGVIHSGPRLASSSTLARTKRRVRRCLGGSSSTEPSLCCRRRVTASRTPSPALAVFPKSRENTAPSVELVCPSVHCCINGQQRTSKSALSTSHGLRDEWQSRTHSVCNNAAIETTLVAIGDLLLLKKRALWILIKGCR